MKIILKILCVLPVIFSWFLLQTHAEDLNINFQGNEDIENPFNVDSQSADATIINENDLKLDTGNYVDGKDRNTKLREYWEDDERLIEGDANVWDKWFFTFLVKIARALKNIFFAIAWIYFLIIAIRLLFTENSEEEFWKFKKWILWITVWIIIMQLAYSFVMTTQNQWVSWALANEILKNIVLPLIKLLETAASFFFIAIAIFAFYRMVTAAWDDEKAKSWKMSIFYAIIGFIVIKVSALIVKAVYSKTLCDWENNVSCTATDIEEGTSIIFKVINWMNGFVWIAVVIMIIYAWVQIIFSNWDEEKIKKAKTSLIYIFIWIFILMMNYLILTFFLLDESSIV